MNVTRDLAGGFVPEGHTGWDPEAKKGTGHFKSGLIGFLLAKALALILAGIWFASHEGIRTFIHGAACDQVAPGAPSIAPSSAPPVAPPAKLGPKAR